MEADIHNVTFKNHDVTFPETNSSTPQNEEFCWIRLNGKVEKINLHDYGRIFSIRGLYEHLFYEKLKCKSPEMVCIGLKSKLSEYALLNKSNGHSSTPRETKDLKILELGAGNGIVGEHLKEMNVNTIIGADILNEAKDATLRDRPGIYDEYFVLNLEISTSAKYEILNNKQLNCLISVAALGFGDIPALAFANAYNLINLNGWIAFNIKEDFLDQRHSKGFAAMIRQMLDQKIFTCIEQTRYCHRLSLNGDKLNYYSIIAIKNEDIPIEDWKEIF